jgi:hypothetical protein
MKKQTVAVDLDGVLAQYMSWRGVEHIGDPIFGASSFLKELRKNFFVMIFTCRCSAAFNPGYDEATLRKHVEDWLHKWGLEYDAVYAGQGKPLATAYVDDRAVNCQPMKSGLAYSAALHGVDQLARVAEAAEDGNYIEELEKLGVAPDGSATNVVATAIVDNFPCRTCAFFVGEDCTYYDGDCFVIG